MINLGIIGCGKWAQNYIKNLNVLKDYVDVLLVCSRKPDSYNNLKLRPCGIHHWVDDYKTVCRDPRIQGIVVATPPESHYEIVKEALINKKHVLCEKPFVFKSEEAEELDKLAKENGVSLIINYIHLWNSFYQKIRDFSQYGDLESLCLLVENPKTITEHHSVLWDWATHDLAMAIHLAGAQPSNFKTIYDEKGILDSRIISIDCSLNDAKCSIFINTNANKKNRTIIAKNKNGQSLQTWDTFDTNPLREVIVDFLNSIDKNVRVTNAPLAISVTKALQEITNL